ncbi:MAG: DUF6790 family protein [Actinomycetota bacterium]
MLRSMLNIHALFPLVTWILPIVVGALVHNAVSKQPKTRERKLRIWLLWFLGAGVGLGGLVGFLEHWLLPDQMAQLIGFAPSFFQYEVAVANLVSGTLGFMSLFIRRRHFWLATIVANSVWYLGDAAGHIYQYVAKGNDAPGNIGGPFISDILQPLILILLYVAWRKATSAEEVAA